MTIAETPILSRRKNPQNTKTTGKATSEIPLHDFECVCVCVGGCVGGWVGVGMWGCVCVCVGGWAWVWVWVGSGENDVE